MQLLSINVGTPRDIVHGGRTTRTGIFKSPVAGPVMLRRLNFEGDEQADLKHHGGPDKAVYAYPHEHYATWAEELGRSDFVHGQFGENLTVTGLLEEDVHIGDTFRIGAALLQVTQPRQPCAKLGLRMGDPTFVKRFHNSLRTGFYLRVLEEGPIEAGAVIQRVETEPHRLTVRAIYQLLHFDQANLPALERALEVTALSAAWQAHLREALDAARANA